MLFSGLKPLYFLLVIVESKNVYKEDLGYVLHLGFLQLETEYPEPEKFPSANETEPPSSILAFITVKNCQKFTKQAGN